MAVQNKVLYAFRGWIAFVAFMDLGTAGRSYIERRSFLSNNAEEHLDVLTLLGLAYLPSKLKLFGTIPGTSGMDRDLDDENVQILRQMGNFRRRKPTIKNKHV
ncbi:unnamed protein product [Danaus chrysippus]|uniref:(African queen) hypothetical protein n=1 Tax=Danaus chrysippus TaxID=151541 RepID=A0A8J2QYZ3_9NEOP|nr:unnamed protein product [Danaus chrysippus]